MMEFNNTISVIPIVSFRTHKDQERMSSCQDYYNYNLDNNCFAIADGATQSFYPSIWAQLLVDYFCQNPEIDQENWQQWLKPIQEEWLETVEKKVKDAEINNSPVWITNKNLLTEKRSATSTFIGIQFIDHQAKISLVGDSCLFIFQDNKLLKTYLLEKSEEFGYRPEYFASYRKDNDFAPKFLDINLEPNKFSTKLYFVLATDALAEYIFEHIESDEQQAMLNTLLELSSQKEFDDFVASARNNDPIKMKNDDVTLVILEVDNCKISSFLTETKEGKLEKSGLITTPISEDKSDSTQKVEDEPEHSDIPSHPNDQTSEEKSNSRELQNPINSSSSSNSSTAMVSKNSRRVPPSRHQSTQDKPPVIKGLDGIRNLLLVFVPISLLLSATTLYSALQLPNKINSTQPDQKITDNSEVTEKRPNTPKPKDTPPQEENTIPKTPKLDIKYTQLNQGTPIYQDSSLQNIFIPKLSDSFEVLIIEEGENWQKIIVELYAHKSLLLQCDDCQDGEIKIKEKDNIRESPNSTIFGQFNNPAQFKKSDNSDQDWYKFAFVGYVKK